MKVNLLILNNKIANGENRYINSINDKELLRINAIDTYINNLENLNRNNPNRILEQQYNSFEDIGNIIKDFRKKMQ